MGGFANPEAEWVCALFMTLGGLPLIRFVAVLQGRWDLVLKDSQIRLYLVFILIATGMLTGWLVLGLDRPFWDSLRGAAFNAISVITTTGLVSTDYQLWGAPAIGLFLALTIVGGCTGSTAGGIKTFRFEILWQAALLYLTSLFLPSRVARPRYQGRPIEPEVINGGAQLRLLLHGGLGPVQRHHGCVGL